MSLRDSGATPAPREPAFAEAPYLEPARAVRLPDLKRIEFPGRAEAREFDLARDPGETRDLPAGAAPELKRLLDDWAAANAALAERLAARGREAGEVELDAETIERLRSLGYID